MEVKVKSKLAKNNQFLDVGDISRFAGVNELREQERNDESSRIIIAIGPSASGKTSYYYQTYVSHGFILVNTDSIREQLYDYAEKDDDFPFHNLNLWERIDRILDERGLNIRERIFKYVIDHSLEQLELHTQSWWDELEPIVHMMFYEELRELIRRREKIYVDGTNLTWCKREKLYSLIPVGYEMSLLLFDSDLRGCILRDTNEDRQTVGECVITQQFEEFEAVGNIELTGLAEKGIQVQMYYIPTPWVLPKIKE